MIGKTTWPYFITAHTLDLTFNEMFFEFYNHQSISKSKIKHFCNKNKASDQGPRKFLDDLGYVEDVPHVYQITEIGRKIYENLLNNKEKAKEDIKNHSIAKFYHFKLIMDFLTQKPGERTSKKEIISIVTNKMLTNLAMDIEKDPQSIENAINLAVFLGILTKDDGTLIINPSFKLEFLPQEFLAALKKQIELKRRWITRDLCYNLLIFKKEIAPKGDLTLEMVFGYLKTLYDENQQKMQFIPGWPVPPIPSAYSMIDFADQDLRTPEEWKI